MGPKRAVKPAAERGSVACSSDLQGGYKVLQLSSGSSPKGQKLREQRLPRLRSMTSNSRSERQVGWSREASC